MSLRTMTEPLLDHFQMCFFLELSLAKKQGSLTFEEQTHILLQHTNCAAHTPDLIFFLFNQMQHHQNIKNVRSKVKNIKKAFEQFAELVNSEEFLAKLEKASKTPKERQQRKCLRYFHLC